MKYIVFPVVDPALLRDKLIGIYEKCNPDTAVVIAFCDSIYEQYWVPQMIDMTNEYRLNNHNKRISVSIECNYDQLEYDQFLQRIVRRLDNSCAVIAPADMKLLRLIPDKIFAVDLDITSQINHAIKKNNEYDQKKTQRSILKILKQSINKAVTLEKVSIIGNVGVLLLICASLLYGLSANRELFIISQSKHIVSVFFCFSAVVLLLLTCIGYVCSSIFLLVNLFGKRKIKKERKKKLLIILNKRFIACFFLQALLLFVAYGVSHHYGLPCFSGNNNLIVLLLKMYGTICLIGSVFAGMIRFLLRKKV